METKKKNQAVIFVDAGPLVHGIGIRYQFAVAAVFGHAGILTDRWNDE